MFCPYCGTENQANVKFCGKCGKPLTNVTQTANVKIPNTPAPPAVNQSEYRANVAVKQPAKVKIKKERKPLFTKDFLISFGLSLLLLVVYCAISYLLIFLLNAEDTVNIKTIADNSRESYMTMSEFLGVCISGNRIFNPTAVTTMFGIGTYIFIFATPVFAVFAFISCIANKKSMSFAAAFSIISAISAAAMTLVVPVTSLLAPQIKHAVSITAGVIYEDIGSFGISKLLIFSSIIIALIVSSIILTVIIKKRRTK